MLVPRLTSTGEAVCSLPGPQAPCPAQWGRGRVVLDSPCGGAAGGARYPDAGPRGARIPLSEVLGKPLEGLGPIPRPRQPTRLPAVLTPGEVRRVLDRLSGTSWLVGALLYGSGLRLLECLTLRAAKLHQATADIIAGRVSLARLFALYRAHHSPRKSASEQGRGQRCVDMWTRVLGADKDPHKITRGEWERFVYARKSGAIDSHGLPVPEDDRRPTRLRTVEADCLWLKWALNGGTNWQDREGRYLLRDNMVRGFEAPREKNPRRPIASQDRYEAVRAVSDQVTMEIRWDKHRKEQRSYLSELLDIVNGTGRRISAVCQLQYEDLKLDQKPYGAIRWPADPDKIDRETLVPIAPGVRAALERVLRERPGVGAAYLFPSPIDPTRPIRYELASEWLIRRRG